LPLEVFTQRNSVADFIRLKLNFIQKTEKSVFEPPFGTQNVWVTYALPPISCWVGNLNGKSVVDFLFVIN